MAYNKVPLPVFQGGSGSASFTAYAPICGGTGTTSAWQSASTGFSTSGYVLTSTGSSSLPTFQASGGWDLLSTQTASSSASLSFNSLIVSSFVSYILFFQAIPATAGDTLNLTISNDNGVTYVTTGYQSGISSTPYDSATISNINTTSTTYLSAATSTTNGCFGVAYLSIPTNGAGFVCTGNTCFYANASSKISTANINAENTSTTMNAFKVSMSSGNISSGTFSLYGVSK
ncbi:MAG: hypothetical protein EPO02_13195 [Nitrospirae bacterium]|nr:MAG: hypothetical protein EPO02_13195 [Nitrospirota bacterium]